MDYDKNLQKHKKQYYKFAPLFKTDAGINAYNQNRLSKCV